VKNITAVVLAAGRGARMKRDEPKVLLPLAGRPQIAYLIRALSSLEKELRDILKDKDAVYVEGGNTFYLLKAVRESSFDKVIKDLIEEGLIYLGASAGAYMACPTIETSLWKVSEKDIKDNYGVTDLTALNLVPFLLKVHYKPEQKEFLQEKIKQTKYPVRILKDGQALLVKNSEVKLIGEGNEIII